MVGLSRLSQTARIKCTGKPNLELVASNYCKRKRVRRCKKPVRHMHRGFSGHPSTVYLLIGTASRMQPNYSFLNNH